MKLVERGENDWKRKIGTVSMTIWVKNQKIKKKKNPGVGSEGSF